AERAYRQTLQAHKKGLLQQLFPAEGQLVPELRFSEFVGEWSFFKGNELFKQVSNKNHEGDLPVLAVTQEHGAIPREEINYHVTVSKKSVKSYKIVEVGDFIISLRSFQGGIEYSSYYGICSPAYVILRASENYEIDNIYFTSYFKSDILIRALNKNLEGLRDGKMISYRQFSEIKIPLPTLPEQQKIANCLSSLDRLIQAQTDKIEALEAHKRGMMQQLFP
ncbi:MAG: restriction endonuclease subunit S, partial [Aureispira sp.]